MRKALPLLAESDQREVLRRITVPTLLTRVLNARSPLSVARQFERAIPDTKLSVIPTPVERRVASHGPAQISAWQMRGRRSSGSR